MKPFMYINNAGRPQRIKLDDNGHPIPSQQFVAFFHYVSFKCISFGLSLNLWPIHIEIHLPLGFIRIGMVTHYPYPSSNQAQVDKRGFGLMERWTKFQEV